MMVSAAPESVPLVLILPLARMTPDAEMPPVIFALPFTWRDAPDTLPTTAMLFLNLDVPLTSNVPDDVRFFVAPMIAPEIVLRTLMPTVELMPFKIDTFNAPVIVPPAVLT